MSTKKLYTLQGIREQDRNTLKNNPQIDHFHRNFFQEEFPFPLPQACETVVIRLFPGQNISARVFLDKTGNEIDVSNFLIQEVGE